MRRFVFLAFLFCSAIMPARAQTPNTINTVAGGGTNPSTATNAYLPGPQGIVRDNLGTTFISSVGLNTVYKVTSAGVLSVYAGNGIGGFSGDGGLATSAELDGPQGLALDANNNLFIADTANNRIRKVDSATGKISTYAGSGNQYNGVGFFGGYTGDGGPATSALMNFPSAIAFDKNGNLLIADAVNNVVRMVDTSPEHIISTYAGNGTAGTPGSPNGDGGPATSAQLNIGTGSTGIAVDANNNLYIADSGDSVVRLVAFSGTHIISTFAGSITTIFTFSGDNGPANQAGLNFPTGVSVDSGGNVFISDNNNQRVRKADTTPSHIITTVAGNGNLCLNFASCGDGGAATSAFLNTPYASFPDASGNLLIVDFGTNRIRTVTPGGTPSISTFAGGGSGGDGGPGTSAVVALPFAVATDAQGNLYFEENTGNRIRRWDSMAKTISTYVGNGIATFQGAPNGDGGLAIDANVAEPLGLALDSSGNLVFADGGAHVVRRVDQATKHISTFAGTGAPCNTNTNPGCGDGGVATSATFKRPFGVAFDSKGNLYISDSRLQRIRKVDAITKVISNYAGTGAVCAWQATSPCGDGGLATSASFNVPQGLAFDAKDNLYVADILNNIIRKIDTSSPPIITTYAFNGQPTFGGDGGAATAASMQVPEQVAVDPEGALFVGGGLDNVVRRIDGNDQSVITVAGDVHNLDGGFNGDGIPSTKALLSNFGVALDSKKNVYIADAGNARIRVVPLAPVLQLTPATLQNFGPVLVGDTSTPQILSVMNTGLDDLTVSNVLAPTGFTVSNLCINFQTQQPAPVSPGGSCLLEAAFVPPAGTVGGTVFSGNITFNTNDPKNPSISIPVAGTAIAPPGVSLAVAVTGAGTGTVSGTPDGLVNGNVILLSCPPSGAGTACTVNFAAGEVVNLVAIPSAGSMLTQWNVNGSTTVCPATQITCAVTMSAAQSVTVTFATATISVTGLGNGTGTIADNLTPHLINCSYNGTTTNGTCSNTYPAGTASVIFTATPTGTSSFAGWLGFCSISGINFAGTGPCTIDLTLTIVPTLAGTQATAVFSGPAQPFTSGQVFVGTVDGMIWVYNANGTLAQILNSGNLGGIIAGMNFDQSGNLFAANVVGNTVERFVGGTATPTTFGGPYHSAPLGVVIDPTNNVFVGQSSGDNTLLEFSSAGALANTFFPAFDQGGIGYLELLDDSARVLYTSSTQTNITAGSVRNYDIVNNHQNPDFAINLPGGPAFALRELSDKSVLVANSTEIVHLDPNGNLLGSPSPYKPGGGGLFFALNLDPTGTSFWTGDALTGKVYQVRISDGMVLNTITTGLGFNAKTFFETIFGIAVFGQPQSGGADLAVTVNAPTTGGVGTQITYTATITNNGPLAAAGVSVTDSFPAGVTVNSAVSTQGPCTVAQTVTCTIGTMANGAMVTVTIKVTPTAAMTLNNTVTANATTPDPNPGNNSFTTSTTVLGAAQATITMTAPSSLELGLALTYQIQVTNPGGTTLTGIAVTDTLPGGLSATSPSAACTGTTTITCTIGTLTPGQVVDLSILIVPTATGSLTNTATVTGGNMASATTNVITGGVPIEVEVDSANPADFTTTSPSSGTCTTVQTFCTSYFQSGTPVTVTASGPGFIGWSVNNSTTTCPGTGTCTVTLTSPTQVIAAYSAIAFPSSQLTGVVGIPYGTDLSRGVIGGVMPYTITLTGTLPNGLAFTAPSISGIPTATGVTPLAVNITDSIGEKGSTAVTLTIINPPTGQAEEALMFGNYGLVFHGVSDADSSFFGAAGSLHFNGRGLIDSGTLDTNANGTGKTPQTQSVTGTYSIGPDHRCLITLHGTGIAPSGVVLACSVGDVYQGVAHTAHLINFDDNTGTGNRGAGIARLQDPNAFSAASFAGPSGSGTYIYGGTGQGPTFERFTELGLITVNNSGAFSSGSGDSNDNGTLASLTFTGTYSDGATLISSTTGRTAWTFNTGTTAASYIIDANNVVFMTTNPGSSTIVFAGTAERQLNTAAFDATFLSGPDVVTKQGPLNAGKQGSVFIGVATFTPAAGPNPTTGTVVVAKDVNAGGATTLEGSENNTFTIAPSGRFVTTIPGDANQPISYLSRPNHGYTMDTVANPRFGTIDLQTGRPYTVANLATDYFFGGREPSSTTRGEDASGVTSISNNALSATFDQSHEGGRLDYASTASFGISVAPTGRLVFTNNRSNLTTVSDEIGQVITPSHTVFTEIDPTQNRPTIHESQSFVMPAGNPSPNPVSVNFPTAVAVGSIAISSPITFTNDSDGLLSITGHTNPVDFFASGTCLVAPPVVVLPHCTCQGIVTFAPQPGTPSGGISENLIFQTDAGNVTITATGTVAGQTDTLTVTITGTGSVTSTSVPTIANEINCANPAPPNVCSATFNNGTSVSLTATPGTGQMFNGWTAGPCISSATNPCNFAISATTPNPTASFVLIAPTLTSIAVTPLSPVIAAGQKQQFTATGTFTSGPTQDITTTVTWASSLPGVATISNTAGSQGSATAVANGTTLINATLSGVTGAAALTVAPGVGLVSTGNLNTKRSLQTATLLNDGTVLVVGGAGATGFVTLASAETYNPNTGLFTATGNMNSARLRASATLLPNGMVLVAGGQDAAGNYLATAELYNPATGTFTLTGSMTTSRAAQSAILLPNGTVLIAGGATIIPPATTATFLSSAEIYNPATGKFTPTGSMTFTFGGLITLLNTGKVLIVGGPSAVLSADLYDPAAGTFTPSTGVVNVPLGATATLLNSGMVLFTGGLSGGNATSSAELYNPTTDTFTTTGSLITGRFNHSATLLSNGMVLVAAGYVGNNASIFIAIPSAELYDPAAGTFTETASLNVARDDHTATLLNIGKILITGGDNADQSFNVSNGDALASSELFTPSTFTPPGLTAITVTPANPTIAVGSFQRFVATGTFTGGPAQTLASITWLSSNTAVASITNDVGSKGFADASPGTTTITARAGTVNGSTLLTVVGPATHFLVSAQSLVSAGTAFNFTVTAQDAANNTVTTFADTVNFSSTDGAAILPASDVGLTNGTGNFQATLNTVGPQTITVTDANTASIKGVSNTITVSAGAPQSVNAHLIDNGTGAVGTVTDNSVPQQINCTDATGQLPGPACTTTYPDGTTVTFTATPGAGAAFGSWNGSNVTCQSGTAANVCTVTITGFTSLDANFTNGPGGPFTLTVAPAAGATGGGRVTSGVTGGSLNCTLVGTTTSGTCTSTPLKSGTVSETIPQADANSTFAGYAGSCPTQVGSNCFVPMSQNQTVTPVFNIIPITLNVAFVGNGTVTSDAGGINCSNPPVPGNVCKTTVDSGTIVTLTETPGTGYSFAGLSGWSPSLCGSNSTATTCILTLNATNEPSGTLTMTATFTKTAAPALAIAKSHIGTFTQGQQGAHYTVTISNGANAVATSGTVTVTDTAPAGLTLVSMAGTGWTCGTPNPANVCTRADVLNAGGSYPPITVTVNVAGNATSPQVNQVGVTGGGSAAANASDSTTIVAANPPVLSITKSHLGTFTQGQQGAQYTVTVSTLDAGNTNGTAVTVTDTIPTGLTLAALSGAGWSCTVSTASCTRSDVLNANLSYPPITVTVNVATNALALVMNTVTVSGGGAATPATASDPTVITPTAPPVLSITKSHIGTFTQGQQGAHYTVTVSNGTSAGLTTGVVSVTETAPAGLTLVSMAGTGWTCAVNICTRADVLNAGASYPPITVTVNVLGNATSPQINQVNVSGGGTAAAANASDSTTIIAAAPPIFSITKSHSGNFTQGQQGATYTVTVSTLDAGNTNGTAVTVTDTIPTGLTLSALSGTGWTCTVATASCTRSDVFNANSSYPPITVTVNVAANALALVTNTVTVSGGGAAIPATTTNPTTILAAIPPIFSITKSHLGNFTQGQQGALYTVTVSNAATASPTSGTVTVTDTLPAVGLTLASMSGTGWTCTVATASCTRSDVLNANSSYPSITVTVNVATNAPALVMNTVTVSGGGAAIPATFTNPTTITPIGAAVLTITKTHVDPFTTGQQGALYTVTVSNAATAGPTNGLVTVTDAIPTGLTIISMSGTGWTCAVTACTRTDALAPGASYPSITVTVNVLATIATTVTNRVTVAVAGLEGIATATDLTNIVAAPFTLVITPPAGVNPGAPVPILPGGQLALGLVLTPISGFGGTVTLSCVSSAPQFITCAPAPSQVKISVGGTQVAIVINTFCQGAVPTGGPMNDPVNGPGGIVGALELLLAALSLASIAWAYRRRSRWALSFALLMLMALGSAACGSLPKGPAGRTPPGNYTLFIKATANGQSATAQESIMVVQ